MSEYNESFLKKCRAIPEFDNHIPTIENLFQSLKKDPRYKDKSEYDLLSNLRIAMNKACCDKYLRQQPIMDCFIIGYMKLKYGQDWYEDRNKFM